MSLASIKSSFSDAELLLHSREGEDFVVEFNSVALNVVRHVCGYTDEFGLARFFQELASHSRPWKQPITWQPLEGEFAVSATCNNAGHVLLKLAFNRVGAAEEWGAVCDLRLELGQLQSIAATVSGFFEGEPANKAFKRTGYARRLT